MQSDLDKDSSIDEERSIQEKRQDLTRGAVFERSLSFLRRHHSRERERLTDPELDQLL